jgi:hypothetical protein
MKEKEQTKEPRRKSNTKGESISKKGKKTQGQGGKREEKNTSGHDHLRTKWVLKSFPHRVKKPLK